MGFKLTIEDAGTGVPMTYHVISSAAAQYANAQTYVVVSSYFSQDAYKAGKRPLGENPVMINALPAQNADLIDWVQGQLVLPVDPTVDAGRYLNRWGFSGGTDLDHEPQPAPVAAPAPTPTPAATPVPDTSGGVDTSAQQAADPEAADAPVVEADPAGTTDADDHAVAEDPSDSATNDGAAPTGV